MNRKKRGLAIEYVILTMALVAALTVTILEAASLVAGKARTYRDYQTEKEFLDRAAETYIAQVTAGELKEGELEARFNDNDMELAFQVDAFELTATYRRSVVLYVRMDTSGSTPTLSAYRYTYVPW